MIQRIAIIHCVGQFETVPCLVSTAKMLVDSGFQVDIFIPRDVTFQSLHLSGMRIHFLQPPKSVKQKDRWTQVLTNWVPFLRKRIRQGKYDLIFGVDDWGIILATCIGLSLGVPTVYYSLELLIKDEITTLTRKVLKQLEVYCSQRAKFAITQDEMRADILSRQNNIRRDQVVLLPNSYLGSATTWRTDYLRQKLGIPKGKRIILQAGSIERFTQAIPLAQAAYTWRNDFVLVFHTRRRLQNSIYEKKFLELVDNRHVYLSDMPVPHNELSNLISSADIGVALYEVNPNQRNIYHMGLSSGKISQYVKCSLPIITTDLPLINTMVKQYRCGICVRNCDEIEARLKEIWADYELFRKGAARCFEEKFRFEHNFPALLDKIENIQH